MKLPESLAKFAAEAADKNADRGSGLVDPIRFYAFMAGVEWLYSHLTAQSEFDEEDFREKYEIANGIQGSMQLKYLIAGAKFQASQSAAVMEGK